MIDEPGTFFDGTFDQAGAYNGTACRIIVEEGPAPASDGFQPRPGRWARIWIDSADIDGTPQIHDKIVDADEAEWDVQQMTREDSVWLLTCLAEQRKAVRK